LSLDIFATEIRREQANKFKKYPKQISQESEGFVFDEIQNANLKK
jgi:hypothetical protein